MTLLFAYCTVFLFLNKRYKNPPVLADFVFCIIGDKKGGRGDGLQMGSQGFFDD